MIKEDIYNRFINAASNLELEFKDVVSNFILKELSLKKETISLNKFSIKLNDETFLVQTAIITALMEAAKDAKEFKRLHDTLKQRQVSKKPKEEQRELNDFDKILTGIMKVPNKKEATK